MSTRHRVRETLYKAFVKLLENLLSKKFLVFIATCWLLAQQLIPPTVWLPVALAVLGVTSVLDYKQGPKTFEQPGSKPPVSGPPEIP